MALVDSLSSPLVAVILGTVVELSMRLFKTDNPKSLFYTASNILKALASILSKMGSILDGVVQRTKDAPASVEPQEKKAA